MRHVSDGDTVVLDNGWKVRLIGIDTPEISDESRNRQNARRNHLDEKIVDSFAQKAKNFLAEKIEGKEVRLEYDWQPLDKYGRHLAYVYRSEDNLFLNAEVLRQGYGFAYNYFPYRESQSFTKIAEEARMKHRGLWKQD